MSHKNTNRLQRVILLTCMIVPVVTAAALDLSRLVQFDISPQPLATALLRFSEQASVQFTAPGASVAGIQSPGVRGKYAPDAALKLLLRGTGLMFEVVGDSTIAIRADGARSGKAADNPNAAPATDANGNSRFAQVDDPPTGAPRGSNRSTSDNAPGPNRVNIEEIVVTATKREVKLQDVPVAVSVLTTQNIVERGYTEYGNYLNSLPGVYFADGGPGRSVIRIRGLSASEGSHGTLVATYFGETPTSVNGTFPNLRLVDIERVEVLRGPQGTLFGANALAGTVRILPVQPDLDDYQVTVAARGFSTARSDDPSYHIEGVVNVPLVENRFAVRLVGFKDDIAGYIDNRVSARPALDYSAALGLPPGLLVLPALLAFERKDVNREDTVGGRAAALWQPTERLGFELGYAAQRVTLESDLPLVTPSVGDYAQSRALDVFSRGEGEDEVNIASLTAHYDWDNVSLTSASAWSTFDQHTFSDVTQTAVRLFGVPIPAEIRNVIRSDAFTQELRLQSRGSGPLQWLLGVFYLDRDRKVSQPIPDYSCPTCLAVLFGERMFLNSRIGLTEEQRAVFGELAYDFAPRWTASVGARWFEQDLRLRITDIEGLLAASLVDTDNRGSTDEFNPAFHLRFRPSDAVTLYAQAAKGFRSGAPNNALPAQCQAEAQARGLKVITDPDTLWNYEVGAKSSLAGGRLSVNAAVYDGDWSGIQVGAGLACAFAAIINGGDATTRGVEIELAAQLSAWRFNLAASYNETKFGKVDPDSGFIDRERVPAAPDKNGSAGVQYDFTVGGGWSGFARADYQYVGDIRLIFPALVPRVITQDGYGTGNVRLGFLRESLALEIFARNVTDKRAVLSTGHPAFGGDQIIVRPRELGIELRYSYR